MSRQQDPCLVCTVTERTSYHFGAQSCMACASFFRRTVSFGIRFLCKANNDCVISPDIKFICRSCRYKNCIKAGMRREQVQQKKDEQKMPKYILESRKLGVQEIVRGYTTTRSTGSVTSGSDSPTNSTRSNSPEFSPCISTNGVSETIYEISSEEKSDLENEQFSTILNAKHDELLQYYVKQIERATVMRQCELPEDAYQQFVVSKKINDQLALDICQTCPGTDLLEQADLDVLFRYCSFSSLWMDSAWLTVSSSTSNDIVGGDTVTTNRKVLGYENGYEKGTEGTELSSTLINFILRFHSSITTELSRLQLDVFEYAALKSFCIWKLALLDSTLTLKIVAHEQYSAVTSAISKYYHYDKNMDASEVATRLGDITLILGSIFNVYQDMLQMYQVLEVDLSIEN